ncbi:MAG: hypothetical protein LBQ12_05600, partial [Deltaproteobacteria bacterium]|nr:hypothetical protein [Deltaproteobacteria bacterium]
DKVASFAWSLDPPLAPVGEAPSRVLGPKGNQEVFLYLVKRQPGSYAALPAPPAGAEGPGGPGLPE